MKAGKGREGSETELKELFMWREEGGGRDCRDIGGIARYGRQSSREQLSQSAM